jgi:hypothetical protein
MPRFFCACAVLAFLGCNRAPDEPVARTRVDSQPSTVATAPRCIVALPTAAPQTPEPAGDRCPSDPTGRFKLAHGRVAFTEAGVSVDAELARTDDENERGLMYRKSMAEDEGMLFFLSDRRVQTFWMHNTCIPLDMLFVTRMG